MPDHRSYAAARNLADDAVNHEGDLRAESWRMTRMVIRQAVGRTTVRLGDSLRRVGWSLLRPFPTH